MQRINKRIILVGCGGSGKDYLAKRLVDAGLIKDVSLTTRDRRNGEVAGYDYNYISDEEFVQLKDRGHFYECVQFGNSRYGTSQSAWDHADVFIQNPSGIESIKPEDRGDCVVVFLDIPEHIRYERMMMRKDDNGNFFTHQKVQERIKDDKKDFAGYTDFDFFIKMPNFDAEEWVNILKRAIKNKEKV